MLNECKQKEFVFMICRIILSIPLNSWHYLKTVMSAMLYMTNWWIGYLLVKILMCFVCTQKRYHDLEQKRYDLPSTNLPIYVPVHSFVNSMFKLLMASDLMKSENLLFPNTANTYYIPPRNMTTPLVDINSGKAYYKHYEQMNLTDNDVIIPLMLFADGMQIDKNRWICQEPWIYTLGVFKQYI